MSPKDLSHRLIVMFRRTAVMCMKRKHCVPKRAAEQCLVMDEAKKTREHENFIPPHAVKHAAAVLSWFTA